MTAPARAAAGIAHLATLVCSGCGRGPEPIADRFVDAYFVQASQKTALGLSTGLATRKLEEELALVSSARAGGKVPFARPTIRVRRRHVEVAGDRAQVRYEIELSSGAASSQRRALVVLRLGASERWRVSNWSLSDAVPDMGNHAAK